MVCSGEKIYCARSPGVGQNKGLRLPTQRCFLTKFYPLYVLIITNKQHTRKLIFLIYEENKIIFMIRFYIKKRKLIFIVTYGSQIFWEDSCYVSILLSKSGKCKPKVLETALLCQIFVYWVRDFKFWLLAYLLILFNFAKFQKFGTTMQSPEGLEDSPFTI